MVCYLVKQDATNNQQRFYSLHLAPTLFGDWSLIREWGRLGSPGTVKFDAHETESAAQQALEKLKSEKLKRGYQLVNGGASDNSQ